MPPDSLDGSAIRPGWFGVKLFACVRQNGAVFSSRAYDNMSLFWFRTRDNLSLYSATLAALVDRKMTNFGPSMLTMHGEIGVESERGVKMPTFAI